MSPDPVADDAALRPVTRPRPGHVDLAGALKHQTHDAREVLERASARETAARVAVGSFCRLLLRQFKISIASHVLAIGNARLSSESENVSSTRVMALDPESQVRCADAGVESEMIAAIDQAAKDGDTLGGVVEIIAVQVPPGLGSHTQWDRKLDGQIAQALMSVPAVKAVEIGEGIANAGRLGSDVHDEIFYDGQARRFWRKTNHAGGLEAGITNGAELRARMYVKPIPTLRKALMSVDMVSKEPSAAAFERSDTCVVPAAGVVGEAMLGIVLTAAFLEKFGGDTVSEIEHNFAGYERLLDAF